MAVGDIRRRYCNGSVIFEWTIYESFPIVAESTVLVSPRFNHLENFWNLTISRDLDSDYDWLTIHLWRRSDMPLKSVWYTIGIKTAMGIEEKILCDEWMREYVASNGAVRLIRNSNLFRRKSELFPSGKLTIICTLKDEPSSTEDQRFESCATQTEDLTDDDAREDNHTRLGTRGEATQQKHFKDLLLEGQDHDATLKVKDREFRDHKNILRARSPVFAAMFTHNMKEAECGDVTIEDCDPNAFGKFLQYVYTGKADNLTASNALGLYYAGDKYDFPDLKEMCVEFLKTSLSTNVVCDIINMAMKHSEGELLDCATSFFANNFVEILMTVEWQRFLDCNTNLANELIIKTMKSSYKKVE